MDRSKEIFGNKMSEAVYEKAVKSKEKYMAKYGDDSEVDYKPVITKNPYIGDSLGVYDINLVASKTNSEDTKADIENASEKNEDQTLSNTTISQDLEEAEFDEEKGIIVGNIRMGFGHYRISMAIASAAKSLGYVPYWFDLNSFPETTCTKVISAQNKLYSMGSRISQKSKAFNKVVWEPVNYEGFRKLSYNSSDQKNAELMAPVYKNIPKNIPVVATHVWPAQAALHAGMEAVVNAIPDNWPMALHLAEGSLHTVQTHYAYQGYRILNGMKGDHVLRPMPDEDIIYTGHYIDHELVANIEDDCDARIRRKNNGAPMRFLLTIGGAGAQKEIFASIIRYLMPAIKLKKAVLYVNVGDYKNVWDELIKEIPAMEEYSTEHFDDWADTTLFAESALKAENDTEITGIHGFYHSSIFEAVYCTNLLMRSCDCLVTKPSELAFYPVPKLFIKRVGGHEQWGAIHSAEIGDGTLECRDTAHTKQMLELFIKDDNFLINMCENIKANKKMHIYDGAYEVVKNALERRNRL